MFGRPHFLRSRKRLAPRQIRKSLLLERLEDRRLLAGDLLGGLGTVMDVPESEPICDARSQVERVALRTETSRTVDILFQGDMEIEPMIEDGSIVDHVQIVDLLQGPLSLTVDQFAFDAGERTLSIELPDTPLFDYLELQIDSAHFLSCGGEPMSGGRNGLAFELPMLATEVSITSQDDPIEVENYSVPSLADWNGDGLLDLIVGEKTDASEGKIRVYLNQGSAIAPTFGSPFFVQSEGEDIVLTASGCLGVFPRLADWNDDGRQDLLVGRADGSVQIYINTNTAEAPVFGAPESVSFGEPGAKTAIQVGSRATPVVTDWNGDGRLDLLVGAFDGKIRLYVNESDTGAPDFREELFVQDGDADLSVASGRSSPAVFDFDGDGRRDLVLGDTEGQILFYQNVGTDSAPAFDGSVQVLAGGAAIDLDGTPRSRPFITDYNGDLLPDLVVGAQDGLVRLFSAQSRESPKAVSPAVVVAGEPYYFTLSTIAYPWHNSTQPLDATGDGQVDSVDIDRLFLELNSHQLHDAMGALRHYPLLPFYCDVNDDGLFTPRDILHVISAMQDSGEGEAEGEADFAAIALLDSRPANIESSDDRQTDSPPIAPITISPIPAWRTGMSSDGSGEPWRHASLLDRLSLESLEADIEVIATARHTL